MKTAWAIPIVAVLLASSGGCTRPDWIQSTLVTADVTGVWQGRTSEPSRTALGRLNIFDLHQDGPKVTGTVTYSGGNLTGAGPLEGRVGGDVFAFTVRSPDGAWSGEFTVSGDEMEGVVTWINAVPLSFRFRRISAKSPPS